MITEILHLIDHKQYTQAYELTASQPDLPKIYEVWTRIMNGETYGSIDRNIDFDKYDTEILETVNLYIHLSNSDWEDDVLSEFRKVAKMIIAETSARLMMSGNDIHGELRIAIQQLIDHFHEKELFESKADMSRVKAQLTLTMNLEKDLIGQDMLQYGKNYEAVNQYADCIQIYSAIIRDFEGAEDKGELSYLKDAYAGIVRLTDDEGAKGRLAEIELLLQD